MLTDNQIEIAVRWWMDALKNPTFKDDKDGAEISTAFMFVKIAQRLNPVSEDKIKLFGDNLRNILQNTRNRTILCTDYDPDDILSEALEKAGIKDAVMPWKTTMWMLENTVKVACGYGADYISLI